MAAGTHSLFSYADHSAWEAAAAVVSVGRASTEPALPLNWEASYDSDELPRDAVPTTEHSSTASQAEIDIADARRKYEERKKSKANGRSNRVAKIRSAQAVSDPLGEASRGRFVVPESFYFEAWAERAARLLEDHICSNEMQQEESSMLSQRRTVRRRSTCSACLPLALARIPVANSGAVQAKQWKRFDFDQPGCEDTTPRRTVWR